MEEIVTKCDKCFDVIARMDKRACKIRLLEFSEDREAPPKTLDLCVECRAELIKFLGLDVLKSEPQPHID